MSEKIEVEIAGHKLELESAGGPLRAIYDSYFKGNGVGDFKGFIAGNPNVIVTAPYNIVTVDGDYLDLEEMEDVLEEVVAHIEAEISGDVSYDALAAGFGGGDIVLTSHEVDFDEGTPGDEVFLVMEDEPRGQAYSFATREDLRQELVDELDDLPGNVRAERLLDLLQQYSLSPEDLKEFAVNRDRTKVFSGGVATFPDCDWEGAAVVSPDGRFMLLTANEAQGLEDDDHVDLFRKNVADDFTVVRERDDPEHEQELGR